MSVIMRINEPPPEGNLKAKSRIFLLIKAGQITAGKHKFALFLSVVSTLNERHMQN